MTAPDDLARTLADEIQRTLHARRCSLRFHGECWTGVSKADADALLDGPLASVVSRRDADLRTRIEKVLGHCVHNGPCEVMPNGNCDALTDGTLLRSLLARALDGDTREDAHPGYCFPYEPCGNCHRCRVPADTDTGRGQ